MAGWTMELERVHSRCVPGRKSSENLCTRLGYVAKNQYVSDLTDFRLTPGGSLILRGDSTPGHAETAAFGFAIRSSQFAGSRQDSRIRGLGIQRIEIQDR